jgi:hypothetical protein
MPEKNLGTIPKLSPKNSTLVVEISQHISMTPKALPMIRPKQLGPLFLFFPMLYGCPFRSPYAIDPQPMMAINPSLVGKWATLVTRVVNDKEFYTEPVKIIFTQRNEKEYDVFITGYINELKPFHVVDADTIRGTAYLSMIRQRVFLNAFIKSRFYMAELQEDRGQFSILPLQDGFTAKHCKSAADVRTAIGYHFATRVKPHYAEAFCLRRLQRVN